MIGNKSEYCTRLSLFMLSIGVSVLPACSGDDLVRPTEGVMLVSTSTTGADLDPDGYSVAIDDMPEQSVGIRDTLAVPNLDPGGHDVTLTGVIENCTLGGAGRRTINVIPGDTVTVTFRISCESITPPPPPGGDPQP